MVRAQSGARINVDGEESAPNLDSGEPVAVGQRGKFVGVGVRAGRGGGLGWCSEGQGDGEC